MVRNGCWSHVPLRTGMNILELYGIAWVGDLNDMS